MLAILLMFAFSLNAGAAPAKGETVIDCEFLLTAPRDAAGAMKWMRDALAMIPFDDDVFLGDAPRSRAFQTLGLPSPFPAGARMRIETPHSPDQPHWVRVISASGKELGAFPFHVPPIGVWKQVRGWGENGEVELDLQISREDPATISVGALLGDFAQGRRFLVLRRRMGNLITVALGVDVQLDAHRNFSRFPDIHLVAADGQVIMSRIEVIKAHFRVPPLSARRNDRVH